MKIDWFPLAIPEILGWSLLHSLRQFVILAGIYWLLLRLRAFRRPHYRYQAGLAFLFLMALSFSATLWYEYGIWGKATGAAFVAMEPTSLPAPVNQATSVKGLWEMAVSRFENVLPYLVNVWLIGVAFYMMRLVSNFATLQQIKRRSDLNLPTWIQEKARVLGHTMQINGPVSIRLSQEIEVPMVFGIVKPIVLIPASLVCGMPPSQLEAILAHEFAHIKRQDFTINLCQSFLEMIFFYHPAFWWINETVREAREQATDDLAIKKGANSRELAHALAHLVNQASENAPELAMAAQKSSFPTLVRIQRMMGKQPLRHVHSPLISKTMMITCMLSFILLLGTARQEEPRQEYWLETNLNYTMNSLPLMVPTSSFTLDIDQDSLPIASLPSQQVDISVEVEIDTVWNLNISGKFDSLPPMPEWNIPSPPPFTAVPPFPDANLFVPNGFMEDFGDSLRVYAYKIIQFHTDSTPDGFAQKEKFERKMEELQQKMTAAERVFQEKMREWEAGFKPKMEEFEAKMEAWSRENEPRIKEFEEKMHAWSTQQEAKLKALEEKMRERELELEVIEEKQEKREKTIPDR